MARRRTKRKLVLRGFTIAEVLVAMVVGGFVISALLVIQLQLARAGVRVQDLAQTITAGYQITNQNAVCSVPDGGLSSHAAGDAVRNAKVAAWPDAVSVETVQAKAEDGTLRPGLSYSAYWSKSHRLLGVVGQRCALPERCDYDLGSMRCRTEETISQ